jgi:hypothetical protein
LARFLDPGWHAGWRLGLTVLGVTLAAVLVNPITEGSGRPTSTAATVPGSSPPASQPTAPTEPGSVATSASPGSVTPSAGATEQPGNGPTTGPTGTPANPPTNPPTNPPATPGPTVRPGGASLRFPIRAAFYYPWFPEAWKQQGYNPFSHYEPTLGYYATTAVARQHIAVMRGAGIQAGIASWWGQGSPTDRRIATLLAAAGSFRWTLYYEAEGTGDPSVTRIRADLAYIGTHYATNPAYLRVAGKPVIFVYADGADRCGMVDRWHAANTAGFYVVLKVFPGFKTCAGQPSSWHQYAPAVASDRQAGYSFSISPGFWKRSEATARLVRDPIRWAKNVAAMTASGEPWQLITTFNEWGEGTGVESTVQFGSTYLSTLAAAR